MNLKIVILFCVVIIVVDTNAFVRRDVTAATATTQQPNYVLDSLQRNMDNFRKCIDQSLAQAVSEVQAKQLQPVFTVLGDSLNRVSKAFEDLTATTVAPLQIPLAGK